MSLDLIKQVSLKLDSGDSYSDAFWEIAQEIFLNI